MKKFLLSGLAFGAFIVPAIGADMAPYYKAAPPLCAWCGWYIGVNAGYHWFDSGSVDTATTDLSAAPGLNGDVGAAISAQGTGWSRPRAATSRAAASSATTGRPPTWSTAWRPTFREWRALTRRDTHKCGDRPWSRRGYRIDGSDQLVQEHHLSRDLARPRRLSLHTGVSRLRDRRPCIWWREDEHDDPGDPGIYRHAGPVRDLGECSSTLIGWTAGVGVEWLFWSRWSAKIEYRYYDLGSG